MFRRKGSETIVIREAGIEDAPALLPATTDGGTSITTDRPSDGRLLDRLRTMTVRTHVDRPIRVPLR